MVLTFQNDSGVITGGAFRVVGIFSTASSDFDKGTVFVKSGDLTKLLQTGQQFQEIAVLLDQGSRIDITVKQIEKIAPGMKVQTWKALAPELDYILRDTLIDALHFYGCHSGCACFWYYKYHADGGS